MAKKSFSKSPWAKLISATTQGWELRRPLIKNIGDHFGATVVTLFASFWNEEAQLTDSDAEMLESILSSESKGAPLLLIINSPGGQALAAERIVNVCRAYSSNQFEVVVPHMAKSAATMICFGAMAIHMSDTAELGPVDPQVTYTNDLGNKDWISAEEYVRSYDELIACASDGNATNIEPFIQQLQRYDSRYIEKLRSAQSLSRDISISLLKSGMLSSLSEKEIGKKIDVFLSQTKTRSHGRMISKSGAEGCGLKIKGIDLGTDIWNWIWELYLSSDWVVTRRCRKIMETAETPLSC